MDSTISSTANTYSLNYPKGPIPNKSRRKAWRRLQIQNIYILSNYSPNRQNTASSIKSRRASGRSWRIDRKVLKFAILWSREEVAQSRDRKDRTPIPIGQMPIVLLLYQIPGLNFSGHRCYLEKWNKYPRRCWGQVRWEKKIDFTSFYIEWLQLSPFCCDSCCWIVGY